jgi:CubicO group peptidase (beta-lactamase class C family)
MSDRKPAQSPCSRRRAQLTLTVALSLLLGASLRADDLVYERVGEYLESLRAQFGIPALAVAFVDMNDIVWERAFGKQDLNRSLAARTDTPFHIDGVTQMFTAAMVLRCVEQGLLSLSDQVGQFESSSPDAGATLYQLLTHSSETTGGLVYSYRPQRLEPLWTAVRACNVGSFRKTLAELLDRFAMRDSVPGPDVIFLKPPAQGIPPLDAVERYSRTLERLAVPYSVDAQLRTTPGQYSATTLTPSTGLISTVRDVARFDLALKNGDIIRRNTLVEAWQAPIGANGQRLPHGLGWFVQSHNGMPVVWQFGVDDNGSSSLVVTLPARGLTMILLANSNGLVRPFPLAAGDLTASKFGLLFLNVFAR